MSRGLGNLQRLILETLEAAKNANIPYTGRTGTVGQVWIDGERNYLHEGCYDLRASRIYLAHRLGESFGDPLAPKVTESFDASFSRAVSSLIRRGLLFRFNPWSAKCLVELSGKQNVQQRLVKYARRKHPYALRVAVQEHQVSEKRIRRASRLKATHPELFEAVRRGEISLAKAERIKLQGKKIEA